MTWVEIINANMQTYKDYPQSATNNPKRTRKEIREAIKKIKIKRELKQ